MFGQRGVRKKSRGSGDSISFHAFTLGTFFAAAAAPTPLYRLYQQAFGLSPMLMTTVFAIYAVALLSALLIAGSLSDHLGRRPVIFASLLVQVTAMTCFLLADGPVWLIAARMIQGLATGIAVAAIGAALVDVDRARGQFVNSITPLVGMAIGAIGSSALIQFGPSPLHFVYALLLVVFAVQALAIWRTGETGTRQLGVLASLRPHIAVPVQARKALALVTPINIATWALGGFYLSLVPSLVVSVTGDRAPLTGGAIVAALMLAGAVTVRFRRSVAARRNLALGVTILAVGTMSVVAGVHLASVATLLLGASLSGVGFGMSFLGSIGSIMPLAKADERAGLLAAFYIQSYLAFSIPAVLAGYLVKEAGYPATSDIYTVVILTMSLFGLWQLRAETRQISLAKD